MSFALHRPRVGGSNDWTAKDRSSNPIRQRTTTFRRIARTLISNPLATQSLLPPTRGRWRASSMPSVTGALSSPVVASTDAGSVESVPLAIRRRQQPSAERRVLLAAALHTNARHADPPQSVTCSVSRLLARYYPAAPPSLGALTCRANDLLLLLSGSTSRTHS